MYLESGIYRIVIGELINSDSEGIKQLIRDYSASRIAFGGVMNNNNFISSGLITFSSYCEKVHSLGGNRIVILDKNWETKTPDFEMFREMHSLYKLRFTLIEACKNYKDLETLNNNAKYGIDSIVLGDSLYLNNFPCQKIWRIAEALIEPDIYKPKG
jgi:phosphoribosylformimino-5-aminoimidazole carboxamide ribotide isomerase